MRLLILAIFLAGVSAYADDSDWVDDAEMDDRVEQRLELRESLRPHRRTPHVEVEQGPADQGDRMPRKIKRAAYRITIEGFETEGEE